MSDALGNIFGSIGSSIAKNPLAAIGTGISGITNFLRTRTQNNYLNSQLNYQKFLRSLTSDPAKMNAYVSGFEKPLDAGLVAGVGNEVQAYGAERGLSTSPQIMDEVLAQALGPYKVQEQQTAIQEALSALDLPFGTPINFPGAGSDPTALLKLLLQPSTPSATQPRTVDNASYPSQIPAPDTSPDMAPPTVAGWPGWLGDASFDDAAFAGIG